MRSLAPLLLLTPYVLSCRHDVEGDTHVVLALVGPSSIHSGTLSVGEDAQYALDVSSAESDPATTTTCSHTVFPEVAIESATCSPDCAAMIESPRTLAVRASSPGEKVVVVAYRVKGPETEKTENVSDSIYFRDPVLPAPSPGSDAGGVDASADAE